MLGFEEKDADVGGRGDKGGREEGDIGAQTFMVVVAPWLVLVRRRV